MEGEGHIPETDLEFQDVETDNYPVAYLVLVDPVLPAVSHSMIEAQGVADADVIDSEKDEPAVRVGRRLAVANQAGALELAFRSVPPIPSKKPSVRLYPTEFFPRPFLCVV